MQFRSSPLCILTNEWHSKVVHVFVQVRDLLASSLSNLDKNLIITLNVIYSLVCIWYRFKRFIFLAIIIITEERCEYHFIRKNFFREDQISKIVSRSGIWTHDLMIRRQTELSSHAMLYIHDSISEDTTTTMPRSSTMNPNH